jgi:hypothetical protein
MYPGVTMDAAASVRRKPTLLGGCRGKHGPYRHARPGVTTEQIADLVGHRTTIVTQKGYRHQLKPVISTGATAMNTIFGNKKSA